MNYRTIIQLKSDVEDKVEGASVVDSTKAYSKIYQAFQMLFSNIYPETLYRTTKLTNGFDDDSYVYRLPEDLERIIDVKIGNDMDDLTSLDSISATFNTVRNIRYNTPTKEYSTTFKNGEPVLILDDTTHNTKSKIIEEFNDLTDITVLNINNQEIDEDVSTSDGALKFDLDINETSAYIYKAISTAINITDEVTGDISFTLDVNLPDVKYIDSISLEITDGVTTQEMTVTGTMESNQFEIGDNILKFRLDKNHSLDLDALTILTIGFNYNSVGVALTDEVEGITIDNLVVTNGEDIYIKYLSNAPFYNTDVGYVEEPRDDSDIIELDNAAYNILLYELAFLISAEVESEDDIFNRNLYESILYGNTRRGKGGGLYAKYKARHEDEVENTTYHYYEPKGLATNLIR